MDNTNIVALSVYEMVKEVKRVALKELKATGNLKGMNSFMLWGPPGVGKSDGVGELASELELETSKTVYVHDVRLLLMNPVDLMGIPVADIQSEFTRWMKPKIFDMDTSEDVINILFLDEITAAAPSVQACGYQLTWDKKIGPHELPHNCFVMAAGNRTTDKSISYTMPKALCGRFGHFEIRSDVDSWKSWARRNKIDDRIIAYINFKNSSLFGFDATSTDVAFPSPRSWAVVSKYIKGDKVEDNFNLISSRIGMATAQDFITFNRVYSELPNINDIVAGKLVDIPTRSDILYALSSKIVTECLKYMEVTAKGVVKKVEADKLTNIGNYMAKMPVEFGTLILSELARIPGIASALMQVPKFASWQKQLNKYLV